jgi:hypothetical protein
MDLFDISGIEVYPRISPGGFPVKTMTVSFNTAEGRPHQFKEFLVMHITGGTQHNPIWMIATVQVPQNHLAVKAPYCLDVPENRAAQGISVPKVLIEQYVNILIWGIFHHIDFLEDHLSLALHFHLIKY